MKAKVHSLQIESSTSFRFVMALKTDKGLAYYSTNMAKTEAVRVAHVQLKGVFEDLAPVGDPIKHMLLNRSSYVGRDIDIEIVAQVDKEGHAVINPRTGTAYTQVRLVPSSKDLTPETLDNLWEQIAAAAAKAANGGTEVVNDSQLA